MREHLVHFAWGASHLIRGALDSRGAETLALQLAEEVRVLQAELDRTQRVISGYGSVLERCEKKQGYQTWGNQILLCLICVLVILLVLTWYKPFQRQKPAQQLALTQSSGGTRGSSDSDSQDQPPPIMIKKAGTGPLRPSQLGSDGPSRRIDVGPSGTTDPAALWRGPKRIP